MRGTWIPVIGGRVVKIRVRREFASFKPLDLGLLDGVVEKVEDSVVMIDNRSD